MYCVLRGTLVSYLILLPVYPNFFICFTRVRLDIGYSGLSTGSNENIGVLIRLRLVLGIVVVEK